MPKQFTREMCEAQYRLMDKVIGHSEFKAKGFKLRPAIQSLQLVLGKHSQKLMKHVSNVTSVQHQTAETQAPRDKKSQPIWTRSKKPRTDLRPKQRLDDGPIVREAGRLDIDDLLFTQEEFDSFQLAHVAGKLSDPRQKRFDRIDWIKENALFRDSIWLYQYSTGGAAGGWLHFIWKLPE